MAGLLAARALSESYPRVTLVERDTLPTGPMHRRGIPQGRHLHSMLSRGWQVLEELFPGFLDELVADGAQVIDDGDLSRIYVRLGRYGLNRTQRVADPAALVVHLASRPFLEFHLRRRVAALGGIRFLDCHDVVAPIAATADRLTGVRVVNRATGAESALHADLVVDAMGRAARTPAFLDDLGYGRPAEQRTAAPGTYFSQLLRIPDGMIDEKMVLVRPGRGLPIGGLLAYEHGSWMLTVGQLGIDPEPPADLAGMLALAEHFAPPPILAGLHAAEPLGAVAVSRLPAGAWRRYDRMPRFPAGLVVIGDALCSLNPIHGQGMAMAALQAVALRDQLHGGDRHLPQRFFRAAADLIGPVWAMNQATDRAQAPNQGRRSLPTRLRSWTTNQALRAAEHDIVLTERLFRVTSLVDPPTRLQDPSLLARVLVGNLRRRWAPGGSAQHGQHNPRRRRRGQQTVEPVHQAAVAGQHGAHVLDP
ncbi:hypothetical protein BKN37_17340 [Mycobacterium talmoniae]|uniref:Epoxidase LasC n=2 Tax=Mycobacterium talmoniae TaxID=1858794 RepID=A0A1S1NG81_9MYCO|nr:hypothetical protein BKN37_17340 [Mycobacterium talmoniae]